VTNANQRACLSGRIETFRPDIVLASTDDPAQLLLETALRAEGARVVYLARATLAVPFGPDCAFPSEAKTERLRAVQRVVGVSQYVAGYFRKYAGIDAIHVPISLLEPGDWPALGQFTNEFVTLVNPCAVKGLSIFVALADAFPETRFAAVPTWGTNEQDRALLRSRTNIRLLDPVDDIDVLLARTRVIVVPSLWAEARSRIVLEAMLRGVPVMAANVGGIPEAKMGVPYLLPVNPILKFQPRLDDQMVPVAEVPAQDMAPWRDALARLLTDREHYEEISRQSRAAAMQYAANLNAEPFEHVLEQVGQALPPAKPHARATESLSPEKRRLLALRLRKRAPAATWFPGADSIEGQRLFWFPHAGGGTATPRGILAHVPVRLPGRESRVGEAPFERMAPLVEALADAIDPYLAQPFAFFGHSMGAVVAFELARLLRRRGKPLPRVLIASSARAPQYRRNHVPPLPPTELELLDDLRRLESVPSDVLDNPAMLRALLTPLKADVTLYRNYIYTEDMPLPCPIRAYGGAGDPDIRSEHLEAWAEQTTASFRVRIFPGGHFYLNTHAAELSAALEEDIVGQALSPANPEASQ
jgi:surfactin synthase thioesterase subunit